MNQEQVFERLRACHDEFCRTAEATDSFQPGDIIEWKPGWKQVHDVGGPFIVLPRVDEFFTHSSSLLLGAFNLHGQFELHNFRRHYFRKLTQGAPMNPMIATIMRRERRIRQARAFRRACILSLCIALAAVAVLGAAQSLDLIHLHELRVLTETVIP